MRGVVARPLAIGLALVGVALATEAAAKDADRKSKRDRERFVRAANLRGSGVVVVQADRPIVLWSGDLRLGECDAAGTIRLVAKPGLLALAAAGPDEVRKTAEVVVQANRVHPVAFSFRGVAKRPADPSGMTPPKLIKGIVPLHSLQARRKTGQGPVVLETIITDEGNVMVTRILTSNPARDEAALATVRDWKYEPCRMGGIPVGVYLTISL